MNNRAAPERTEKRIEIACLVLLFFTTIAAAWSSYQAALWSNHQVRCVGAMSRASLEAVRLAAVADELKGIDIAMFQEYYAALAEKKKAVSDGIFRRFRPEMKAAVQAWLATRPFENPNAPQGPLVMKEYISPEEQEAARKNRLRDQLFDEVKASNEYSTDYVRVNTLFAPLIFLGGALPQFRVRGVKLFILGLGFIVLIVTLAQLAAFPVLR